MNAATISTTGNEATAWHAIAADDVVRQLGLRSLRDRAGETSKNHSGKAEECTGPAGS
jgi:hypothetical protein